MDKFMSAKDLSALTGTCLARSREILKQINKELEEQGYLIINQYKAPRSIVLKKLGLTKEV